MIKKITLIIATYVMICSAQFDSTLVVTELGPIRGKRYESVTKFYKRQINAFIGIPYARPPLGVNRFRVLYNQLYNSTMVILVDYNGNVYSFSNRFLSQWMPGKWRRM